MLAIELTPQVKRLVRAGLLKPGRLTASEIRTLNRLTTPEVNALIGLKRRLGCLPPGQARRIGMCIIF